MWSATVSSVRQTWSLHPPSAGQPASCAELRLHAGQSREAYARDGFLVRRGFLDEGQLDQLGGPVFRAYRDHSYPETEAYPQHGAALSLRRS